MNLVVYFFYLNSHEILTLKLYLLQVLFLWPRRWWRAVLCSLSKMFFPPLKSVIRNNKMDLFGSPLNIFFSAWFRDNYPAVSDDSTSISPGIPWFCFLDGFSWPFYVIAIFESLLCIFIFRPFCIKPTLVETLMLIDFVYCFEKYEINANFLAMSWASFHRNNWLFWQHE